MDKIKGLLTQIGASEDLAKQLCEELESYDKQIQVRYENVYKTKLDQAKTICVEEVKKYKVDLARKVRVFLEGKSSQVENRLDQQRAIEEGEAKVMLRKVKELTESIEVADDAELQALRSKLGKLETKNVQLAEDKKKALVAANRANKIALEIIERSNRQVVSEEDSKPEVPKEGEKVVAEAKKVKKAEGIKKQKALKEEVKRKKTKQAKPKTTRRTLTESQSPQTAKPRDKALGIEADNDILNIAESID
jgi:hypothetical protein